MGQHLRMYLIRAGFAFLVALAGCNSMPSTPPEDFKYGPVAAAAATVMMLDTGFIVKAGRRALMRNQAREKEVYRLAREVTSCVERERIGLLTAQDNILIKIPGKCQRIVYIVAHYDMVDSNPLAMVSMLLNGILDPFVSWSYMTHGAIDNASGVAVALQLARVIKTMKLNMTYHVLLTGAEEAGLHGARTHVSRMEPSTWNRVVYAINIDGVGVRDSVTTVDEGSHPLLKVHTLLASDVLGIPVGVGNVPPLFSTDERVFRNQSILHELGRGFLFNGLSGLIPQKSWFTKKFYRSRPTIGFSAGMEFDLLTELTSFIPLPTGIVHGPRDRIDKLCPQRMYEDFAVIWQLVRLMDAYFKEK